MVNTRILIPLLLIALVVWCAGMAGAQNAPEPDHGFRIGLPSSAITEGDTFSVTITGPQRFTVRQGDFPTSGPVQFVPGRSGFVDNTTIRNGRVERSVSRTQNFYATGKGEFTLGPLELRLSDGNTLTLPAVTGEIVEPEDVTDTDYGVIGRPTGSRNPMQSSIFGRTGTDLAQKVLTVVEAPEEVYYGEAFRLRTWLFHTPDISESIWSVTGFEFPNNPDLASIREAGEIQLIRSLPTESVRYKGRTLQRTLVAEQVVAPVTTGKITVRGAQVRVGRAPGSLFDNVEISVPERQITVRQLPPVPPDAIDQVVGNITVSATVEDGVVQEGDPVTLTLRLSGQGWLGNVLMSGMPSIEGLSTFAGADDVVQSRVDQASPDLVMTTTITRTYRAERPGRLEIPPLTFAVVDPETGEQSLRSSEPLYIEVRPSTSGTVALTPQSTPETVEEETVEAESTGPQFVPVDPFTRRPSETISTPVYLNPVFAGANGAALLAALLFWAHTARRRRYLADDEAVLRDSLSRTAEEHLREAKTAGPGTSEETFYGHLAAAVTAAVSSRIGGSAQGLTAEESAQAAEDAGAAPETVRHVREVLEACAAVRYVPSGSAAGTERGTHLQRAEAAVNALIKAGSR